MRLALISLSVVVWLASAVGGTVYLWQYASTPGAPALAPNAWPAASLLRLSRDRNTLVFALHPHCPCSRASVEELGRLLAEHGKALAVYALLVEPRGVGPDWGGTSLAKTVASLPGVTSVVDRDAREAELFGARTSGEVLLYDRSGRLLFHGGITDSRGHMGDNAGREAISTAVARRPFDHHVTPVFGCPLLDEPIYSGKAGNASCRNN